MAETAASTSEPAPKNTNQQVGQIGEDLAAQWYRRRGYRIVERNWRCRNGEIDLIVRRGSTLVFCEVKTRRSRRYGHPAEAVTPDKQRRIRQLAARWLQTTRTKSPRLRFDVAAVERGRVRVYEAAF